MHSSKSRQQRSLQRLLPVSSTYYLATFVRRAILTVLPQGVSRLQKGLGPSSLSSASASLHRPFARQGLVATEHIS